MTDIHTTLGFAHFLDHTDAVARVVLLILLLASLVTWYLIASKSLHMLRVKHQSQRFLKTFWEAPSLEAVAKDIGNSMGNSERDHQKASPFAHLLHHGFVAVGQLNNLEQAHSLVEAGSEGDMLTRALRRAIDESKSSLEFGQTFLATVASSAPFVGLLGTVWGIYHALMAIGLSGQSSLDKVAGPVGEALIMTGIGLAVAIPAAVAYNSFARATRNTLGQLNSFAYDIHTLLVTGSKASPKHMDAKTSSDKVVRLVRHQSSQSANKMGGQP